MHDLQLLNLLRANARKGEFKAEGNVIFVYDVIVPNDEYAALLGGISAEGFVKTLHGLSGDVDVRLNSPGGEVFGAKAMAQAIREYPGNVTVHVDGLAASAATFLTSAADKTVIAPGSMLMIHKGWTLAMGNADDFKARAALLDKVDGTLAADYAASAERRGKEAPDFIALMAAETWFTPEEAIAAGLADELAETGPKNKVDWDLSAYEHAPKQEQVTITLDVDTAGIRAAIDEHVARIRADLGLSPDDEEAPDTDEIEARRRRMKAAIDLRPAA